MYRPKILQFERTYHLYAHNCQEDSFDRFEGDRGPKASARPLADPIPNQDGWRFFFCFSAKVLKTCPRRAEPLGGAHVPELFCD